MYYHWLQHQYLLSHWTCSAAKDLCVRLRFALKLLWIEFLLNLCVKFVFLWYIRKKWSGNTRVCCFIGLSGLATYIVNDVESNQIKLSLPGCPLRKWHICVSSDGFHIQLFIERLIMLSDSTEATIKLPGWCFFWYTKYHIFTTYRKKH